MPDHFCVDTEIKGPSTARHKRAISTADADVVLHSNESLERDKVADSLLSKHNGWITIDGKKVNRK